MRTRVYRNGTLERENFPLEDVSDYVSDPGATVWVDLFAPGQEELDQLGEELGLHHLAVEDALHERQRPKLDVYENHVFVSAYAIALDAPTGELRTTEVAAFVTHNALVTVRQEAGFDVDAVVARWDQSPDLAKHGVSYLLYGLLDVVVDGHFAAVQSLDDEMEALEDLLFADKPPQKEVQRRMFRLRKSLVQLRRVVVPMREVVNSVMRRDLHVVDGGMVPYWQDVYDHVLRATDWTESLRDFVTTLLETNLTIQGNRLNLVMKKVTSWAAIIAVPTAITGFYGQNIPFPGYLRPAGFYVSSVVIIGLSLGLYVLFRWRDWI